RYAGQTRRPPESFGGDELGRDANIALAQPGDHPRSRARRSRSGAFGPHARRADQLAAPDRAQRPEDRAMVTSPESPSDARACPTRLDSALRQPGAGNCRSAIALRLPAGDHHPRTSQIANYRPMARLSSEEMTPAEDSS